MHPPAGLDVTRVRGTKNPDRATIASSIPIWCWRTRRRTARSTSNALRAAGIAVWVTAIETVDQAIASLSRLFTQALQRPIPGWLEDAGRVWSAPAPAAAGRVVVPIWRDPWMVVGSATFTGDLVARLGLQNIYANHSDRYPHIDLTELQEQKPDLVLLPDEPYRFTPGDGPESFPGSAVALVSGRNLTWYGPSLTSAREALSTRIRQALSPRDQ